MRYDPDNGILEGIDEFPSIPEDDPELERAVSQMPDHSHVE